MQHFSDRLTSRISELGNPTVVGLDPRLSQIPEHILANAREEFGETTEGAAEAILSFNKGVIDAVADIVPAVKPQIAFYECYGHHGFRAYEETVRYAQEKGLMVIGDAKRNDIGSTAEAYANGHLGSVDVFGSPQKTIDVDCMTVTPYLGTDGIKPFTKVCEKEGKGIFVLVRTSNPSADEIQGVAVGDELMDELVATLVEGWGRELIGKSGFSAVGAVVGATYPEEAKVLRNIMPNQIFLVPGYGAQGGNADSVKYCFHKNGTGAIVNSSRGIIFAYQKNGQHGEAYAEAAREAALAMKEDLAKLF
ncbi:orotidine-5'-phosphate decarboxylase [Patescibacteria group bacterium]|nr:orotidine-5'-phosphate decarboxylase [Patescibacteria group bacterium]MBU1015803.1 orotidine-5'-phosphate decarboxylase [Patescibacteria group bacterium]MBU1685222.1 orotidine-5'-phosphate decarboxylase [Patescibacteria group bacterium]MBU1938231.1 orotidine-5'-phosphate decarboxylase [Patescibacteria group bacterium]